MLKKAVALVVVAFIAYYLLTAPAGAADVVSDAGGAVMEAFGQVGVFVDTLLS